PKPGATRFRRIERLEDPLLLGFLDSGTGIGNRQEKTLFLPRAIALYGSFYRRVNRDFAAAVACLYRIQYQITQSFTQSGSDCSRKFDIAFNMRGERNAALQRFFTKQRNG